MRSPLRSNNPSRVITAISGLETADAQAQIGTLIRLLERSDKRWNWVRRAAVNKLGELRDPRATAALIAGLADEDHGVAHDAAMLLTEVADLAMVPRLIEHLRLPVKHAEYTVFVLGELRAGEAVPALIEALGTTPLASAEALAKIAPVEAVPALAEATHHRLAAVRDHALRALNNIGGPVAAEKALEACDDLDPDVRERAARVLARWGDARATRRLAALCDGPHVRIALTGLLRLADPDTAPTLWRVFRTTGDRATLHLAGRVLVACGLRVSPTHFAGRAHRAAAAWVLGHTGAPYDTYPLERLLADEDTLVRARAAEALGRLGQQSSAGALHEALRDPAAYVRANAATAVGRLGPPDAAAWLTACLTDPHPAVRQAAEAALRSYARRGHAGERSQPRDESSPG